MATGTNNARRAQHAAFALDYFNKHNGDNGDVTDNFCDLLTNLMHYADTQGIPFDNALDLARMHYAAETGDGDGIE